MNPCKRVISRLDIKGSKLIKGKRFEGSRVLGDPYEFAKTYSYDGIDEIFYSDAVASLYQRNSLNEILERTSQNIFIPITAGGGIRSIQDGKKLLLAGADKLALNTAAVKNPSLINELVKTFGSQCVVISIQVRKSLRFNTWDVMIESGREKSSLELPRWIEEVQERGAGEIIITSVDNDGTGIGADLDLIKEVSRYVSIPMIFGGGISSTKDVIDVINVNKNISGVAIGWALHNKKLHVKEVKDCIKSLNFPMRYRSNKESVFKKKEIRISIIDYSMGNIRSLYNCLKKISINVEVSDDPCILEKSNLIALPGVGSFPEGMRNLKERGLSELIKKFALEKKAIIGICLGMQLLYEEGEEYENCKGIGILKGKIKKLPSKSKNNLNLLLPHVGWNKIKLSENFKDSFPDLKDEIYQYFVHSYADYSNKNNDENSLFISNFGGFQFNSAIKKDNIVGLQFHPERSGDAGIYLLSKIISQITDGL